MVQGTRDYSLEFRLVCDLSLIDQSTLYSLISFFSLGLGIRDDKKSQSKRKISVRVEETVGVSDTTCLELRVFFFLVFSFEVSLGQKCGAGTQGS
jgi:hypothetical protein